MTSMKNIPWLLRKIFSYNKGYLIFSICLAALMGVLPFVTMINTQIIMNTIQTGVEGQAQSIAINIAMFVGIGLLLEVITGVGAHVRGVYNEYLAYEVNSEVMAQTALFDLKDYEDAETYNLIQRAENEAGVRPYKVLMSVISLITVVMKLSTSVFILVSWQWWTVFVIIAFPVFSSLGFFKITKNEYQVEMNRTSKLRKTWYISHLLTKDSFVKEVKMFGLSNYLIELFKAERLGFFAENRNLSKKRSTFTSLYGIGNFLTSSGLIIFAIFQAMGGVILLGSLMLYLRTIKMVEEGVKGLISLCFSLYKDAMFLDALRTLLSHKPSDYGQPKLVIDSIRSIELKNVSYSYQGKAALQNISLMFHQGDKVAIVGHNGSGKTTLVKLLTGIYTDYTGEIRINGRDLKTIDTTSLRAQFAVLFQDFNKYEFSVADNIGLGKLDKLTEQSAIERAAVASGADGFINDLVGGYQQQLGTWFEGGVQLSGGQWQKLALSRAFMRDASVYVLDEPTSALDPMAEFELFERFSQATQEKIGLFITHRFMNAHFANRIVVLDGGQVVEDGRHEQLLANDGYYKRLYNLQLGIA